MPSQKSLVTVNALAMELGSDKRTVARRLEGLPPAEIKTRADGAVVRKYDHDQALRWLELSDHERRELREHMDDIRQFLAADVFPGMLENSLGCLRGALMSELALSEADAWRVCELMAVCLHHGLAESLSVDDLQVVIPPSLAERRGAHG